MTANRDIAHQFAQLDANATARGRGSNFFFDGPTLFSYGRHFAVARHVTDRDGNDVTLLTTRSYSPSTSTHISYARQALSHVKVYNVDNVLADSKAEHKANLKHLRDSHEAWLLAATRSRVHTDTYLEQAERVLKTANEYSKAFRLGTTLKPADISALKQRAEQQKEQAAKRARIQREKQQREYDEKLIRWLAGDDVRLPYLASAPIRMRLIDNAQIVETSQGARFPVSDARRLWPVIVHAKQHGGCRYNVGGPTLGGYSVNEIDTHGTVKAGCHTVSFDACKEIAERIGLPT